jgi:hypothetical protein
VCNRGQLLEAPKRFKRTNYLERVRQGGPANSLLEFLLHLIESRDHAKGALLPG